MISQTVRSGSIQAPTSHEVQEHVVLHHVSWDAYEAILHAMGDRRFRHTYSRGVLEIASRLKRHERAKSILDRIIAMTAYILRIEIQSIGSTTLRKRPKQSGLEPDECYYVAHEAVVRFLEDYDPERDPPPDLAVEVDVTHSSVSRLEVYKLLGIPEVWRMNGEKLAFYRLARGRYVKIEHSDAFPLLTPEVLEGFLAQRHDVSENTLIRRYVRWLRSAAKG